ncbi:sigma-70 family RNA polymerase sigma factor [Parvularcula dongshanensis]|uniref:RNA polymerase sigma-70 factor (ECF subfamily) n=1 Tax=Parvularcula dongshanensis TaxID=1173995 RepID=A0A840I151_9PROT|nr:RNA polymerase sigma-70 factor (ECF subfamily) [Parvularcula dongshanensis]
MTGAREDLAVLLQRAGARDRAAFSLLYDATAPRLYGVSLQVLGDAAEAEEALQEAYVKVWRYADRYGPQAGPPLAWLISITRNSAIDRRRRRRIVDRKPDLRDAPHGTVVPLPVPTPEQAILHAAEVSTLHDCLDMLPQERASAIRDAYFAGSTYAEMAETTGHPEGTLKSWVRRSLSALRDCLEGRGVEERS